MKYLSIILLSMLSTFSMASEPATTQSPAEICEKYRTEMTARNYEGAHTVLKRLHSENYLTDEEAQFFNQGRLKSGYEGFSYNAVACRFDLALSSSQNDNGYFLEWYWTNDLVLSRLLIIDGVVAYSY